MGLDEEVVLVSYGGLLVFGKELLGHCDLGFVNCRRVCAFVVPRIWSKRISLNSLSYCVVGQVTFDHLDACTG